MGCRTMKHLMNVDRRYLAIILSIIILTSGVTFLVISNPFGEDFIYESTVPQDIDSLDFVILELNRMENATVRISFVNDTHLWYSMSIGLHYPEFASEAFSIEKERGNWIKDFQRLKVTDYRCIRSINVTLGTALPHSIDVSGRMADVVIEYDNAVRLGDQELLTRTRSLNCTITENVDFSEGGLSILALGYSDFWASPVNLNIDLPTGLEGRLKSKNNVTLLSNIGWIYRGELNKYFVYNTTMETSSPLLSMWIYANRVTANLKT